MNILYINLIIALWTTAITTLLLGIFVLAKNRNNIVNKTFALYSFSISWWSFSEIWGIACDRRLTALIWTQIEQVGVFFIPTLFIHFVFAILNIKDKKWLLRVAYFISIILAMLCPTSFMIKDSVPKAAVPFVKRFATAGIAYHFAILYFVVMVVYGLIKLYNAYRLSSGANQNRIKYLLWSSVFGYFGGSANFFLVYGISIPFLNPFGTYALPLYIGVVAYAIVRHHLMDIEVVIKKTLVFASLFTIVFGIFVGITILIQQLIGAGGRLLGFGISSLIIIFMVRPLEDLLARLTDRYLFQREYDRQQLLKEVSQGIIGKIELEELKSFISSILLEKMKLENIAVVVEDNILFNWHKENRMPISYYTIDHSYKEKKDAKAEVKARMKELRVSLSIPVFLKNEIFWLLLFGDKKSGRIYSAEDINMLEALSHEISIAIENAVNFQELKLSQMELLRQENLKFVSVLVKGLAHEIFNPLMPLMHKIENLEGEDLIKIYEIYEKNKSRLDKDDEIKFKSSLLSLRESTKSLKNNASHIHLIIDTLSKLEKGDEKTIGPLDIKSFFKEVVTLFGLEIEPNLQQGVVINQDIAQNLPPVKANPTLLKQIFINLYKNSCYAMKNSSTKVININCATSDANQNEVKIEFSDTGSGISPNVHSKIFTYGFTTKGSKGSGIGLNQCRAIIERFGGTIIIESEENKGTRVTIKVPIWEEGIKNVA